MSKTRRSNSRNAMNPLPRLIRASAFDAANMRMTSEGRKAWNEDDYNAMCETQERLVTSCYSRATDTDQHIKYIRFSLAQQLEQRGDFDLQSDFGEILDFIDECIAAQFQQAA